MTPKIAPSDRSLRAGRCIAICLVLCFALVGSGVWVGAATAQPTTIGVTIDDEPLADAGEFVVLTDPTTNISVDSSTTIDLVEIRVNGEIRHSYRPETASFDRAVSLDLDPNENTVEVIANAEDVVSFKTTVIKNTAAPQVQYSSPFTTSVLGGPSNETTVSSGQVTLAGSLHTVSTVDRIRIERTYTYETSDQTNRTDREIYRITDPGESFSQDLLLGNGTNEIVARYTDSNGRTNEDRFRLAVNDATDPVLSLDAPNTSHTKSVRIRGTVRDETKLHRVAINRTSNNASRVILGGTDPEPDPERLSHAFDETITLYSSNDDNEFRLVAEDSTGNVRERTFSVEYDPAPKVTITENRTNATAGTVRIAGNVSEADIDRVTLETINTKSGERLDIARVYEADVTTTAVEFNESLEAVPGETVANLLVTYGNTQYTQSITPSVSEPSDGNTSETRAANGSDRTVDETGNEADVENASGTTDSSEPTGNNEPDGTGEETSPTFLPIRTREAFGGVVTVGAIYLLGQWV